MPDAAGSTGSSSTFAERSLIERLERHRPPEPRYEMHEEIAHGGMGAILEVWDPDLRRSLAMKVIRARAGAETPPTVDRAVLARFLEEAQVTAQLTHPGVVPVHELGIDEQGQVYFTMALVDGLTLGRVFEQVAAGSTTWSLTRTVGVLQRVCETMAYAHAKGVVHRDLKPANVMVGRFGEVYVMDWGLAKVVGAAEAGAGRVRSVRAEALGDEPDSTLATLEGAAVGTPAFMSPEQARGEPLDARSDVYAVGAMLYMLLAGHPPYMPRPGARGAAEIVLSIQLGPPEPIAERAPEAPEELRSICLRAMAREPEGRYATMQDLADDLRRYLEGRVVRAHESGAWAEFRKWVRRNRGTAAALGGALLAVVAGALATAAVEARGRSIAQAERDRVLRLSDARVVRDLRAEEPKLWPAVPEHAGALANWVERAGAVHANLDLHRRTLAAADPTRAATQEGMWERELLAALIAELEPLPETIERVAARRDLARTVLERTVEGDEARRAWSTAVEEVARSPRYRGLALAPQLGLLPLGIDAHSGLAEFWLVDSGERPVRDPTTGRWAIAPETGIVLVLLPGGTATIGSKAIALPEAELRPKDVFEYRARARQTERFGEPWFDPDRGPDEVFHEALELEAFFCSRYELTQGQWERLFHANPSQHGAGKDGVDERHPVENVSWHQAIEAARRLGLALPTEAQWEYACRAGTTTIVSSGTDYASLDGFANVADGTFAARGGNNGGFVLREIEDGHLVHAPVGSFRPNAFGLHDVHGNVWEWCADLYTRQPAPRPGDGLGASGDGDFGTIRGGSWSASPDNQRSANRFQMNRKGSDSDLGVRLVRRIEGVGGER